MPRVITLTGASGSGKSTAIDYFLDANGEDYKPELLKKFKTRPKRESESHNEDGLFTDRIPQDCDLVYEQYGSRYGLTLRGVYDKISNGITPIIIVNDVRVVQDIKSALGPCVISVYLFRETPSIELYQKLSNARYNVDNSDTLVRFNKANAVYRIYIENIDLFDHVILNSWGLDELRTQVFNLVSSFSRDLHWPLKG